MAKINLNDLLKGKVDLTKVQRIDIVPTGRSTYYNGLGGLDSFLVDGTNKTIKFIGTDKSGQETTDFNDGKETLVARSDGKHVEYLSHLTDEPYIAAIQPFSLEIPEGADEGLYLMLAFKEYVKTAYSDIFTGKEDRVMVTVSDDYGVVQISSFKLDNYAISGKAGDTVVVNVTDVLPANATSTDINIGVEDTSVATVTKSGLQFTFKLLKNGSATKAHWVAADGGGAKADATIAVAAQTVAVTGVTLDKTSNTISVGDSATAVATVAPANATNKNVTWDSSDKTVVTVDNTGKYTGVKSGTSNVTVTTEDGSIIATLAVTVN